jgi:hypothetical protein
VRKNYLKSYVRKNYLKSFLSFHNHQKADVLVRSFLKILKLVTTNAKPSKIKKNKLHLQKRRCKTSANKVAFKMFNLILPLLVRKKSSSKQRTSPRSHLKNKLAAGPARHASHLKGKVRNQSPFKVGNVHPGPSFPFDFFPPESCYPESLYYASR